MKAISKAVERVRVILRHHLALSLMRDHPEGIRSVIIDSVAPPSVASLGWTWTNANEGVNNIFRACAAEPACSET